MKNKIIIAVVITLIFFASLFLVLNYSPRRSSFLKLQELKPGWDLSENFFSSTTTDLTKIPPEILPPQIIATTSTNPVQSGQIDGHLFVDNTLRDVELCGEKYRVKQVIIDGVDVVQRIAELAQNSKQYSSKSVKDFANDICSSVPFNPSNYPSGELNIEKVSIYAFNLPPEKINEKNKTYGIIVGSQIFHIAIAPSANKIYTVSGYDGTHTYLTDFK